MIPPFLYHYTKVDSLKAILPSRTIRFTRLDLLNDPTEGYQPGFPSARKNVFVSSWTFEETDSLPMWKMYCGLRGARLKLPIDMFCFNGMPKLNKNHCGEWFIVSTLNKAYEVSRKGIIESEANRRQWCQVSEVYGPDRVVYVPEISKLSNDLLRKDQRNPEESTFSLGGLGLRKPFWWSFENEFRFRIVFAGSTIVNSPPDVIRLLYEKAPVSDASPHIDVGFDESKVDSLEVLLGPLADDDELRGVKRFLDSLNYKYKLKRSDIDIRESG